MHMQAGAEHVRSHDEHCWAHFLIAKLNVHIVQLDNFLEETMVYFAAHTTYAQSKSVPKLIMLLLPSLTAIVVKLYGNVC